MNDLYCPFLWKELVIENDGYVSPCLYSTNKLFNTNISHNGKKVNAASDHLSQNLDDLTAMRRQLSNGVWPKQCINCRAHESKGLLSNRQNGLRRYPKTDENVELKILHFRVGNICNLRCIMCGPWASNQWYNDYVDLTGSTEFVNHQNLYKLTKKHNGKFFLKDSEFNADNWESVIGVIENHSSELEKISFHGGEPFVSKIHHKIIKHLLDSNRSQHIELEYFTNFYQLPDYIDTIVDNFKKVIFEVSIDGVEKINDAVRWPSKYTKIYKNIEQFKVHPNVTININHTINNLNFEHTMDFLEQHSDFDTEINFVENPLYSSIRIMDREKINSIAKKLQKQNPQLYEKHLLDKRISKTVGLKTNDRDIAHHRKLFVSMWNKFSQQQNQNWVEIFPMGYRMYSEWS